VADAEAPQDRLFGRRRGHSLRVRQQTLLDVTLPRLRFDPADTGWIAGFSAVWLEVGFGGGEHAMALAAEHPSAAVIACEVFANGICSLLSRLVPLGAESTAPLPGNLRLWDEDARPLLRILPTGLLERLYLMFPDPWPKSRHAGRRFVSPENIALVARVVRPGGVWRIASDDPTYQAWVIACMNAQSAFAVTAPEVERPVGWPATRYEAKALRAGRRPLYWSFRRLSDSS
jgi:tRNA (guanine-N7-)-methyltransferase